MVSEDTIAQLRQDITTAGDTGDEAEVRRLRGELSKAQAASDNEDSGVSTAEAGTHTGTKDKDYDLIWFVEACLSNALRMEQYRADAENTGDSELAEFFARAQGESRKGAEQGKALLARRLVGDAGNTTPTKS